MKTEVLVLAPCYCSNSRLREELVVRETVERYSLNASEIPKVLDLLQTILPYAAALDDIEFRHAQYSTIPHQKMMAFSLEVKKAYPNVAYIFYCDSKSDAGFFYHALPGEYNTDEDLCSVEDFLLQFDVPAVPITMTYEDLFREVRISESLLNYKKVLEELVLLPRVIYRNGHLALPDAADWLIDTIENVRAEVLKYISKKTDMLFGLSPRDFELFIAAIFKSAGYAVELTPPSRDGGFDLIAVESSRLVGENIFLVECKRYAKDRKVGIGAVQRLVGAVDERTANKGVIVTTSTFTKDAYRSATATKSKMELKDYNDIIHWLALLICDAS